MLDNIVDFDPQYIKPGRMNMTDSMFLSQIYTKCNQISEKYENNDITGAMKATISFMNYIDQTVLVILATRLKINP